MSHQQLVLSMLRLHKIPRKLHGQTMELQLLGMETDAMTLELSLPGNGLASAHGAFTLPLEQDGAVEKAKGLILAIRLQNGAGNTVDGAAEAKWVKLGEAALADQHIGKGQDGAVEVEIQLKLPASIAPPPVEETAPPPAAKGKGGKGAPPPPPEPAEPRRAVATCVLTCQWRLETALPSMAAQRIPALGLRFSAPENREDLATRHALWREELSNANNVPNACAGSSHRWEPAKPTQPHYLSGDIKSRTALEEYERQKNHERIRLDTQVVQREYDILHDKLLRCVTAQQASEALHEMNAYLLYGSNLAMVDAEAAVRKLEKVKLPFERLVRNVWVAGPEVAYDAAKEKLRAQLQTYLNQVVDSFKDDARGALSFQGQRATSSNLKREQIWSSRK
uniref:Uncharacterized protein n=1 Tax=Chrysotila carterae TaxID=13221 RepID=A0A7S4FCI0_CHRCT